LTSKEGSAINGDFAATASAGAAKGRKKDVDILIRFWQHASSVAAETLTAEKLGL
jgi:hypothetical protein